MLVECYDPKGDQWNILQTPILEGRSGPGCTVLDDSIFLVGGYSWSMVRYSRSGLIITLSAKDNSLFFFLVFCVPHLESLNPNMGQRFREWPKMSDFVSLLNCLYWSCFSFRNKGKKKNTCRFSPLTIVGKVSPADIYMCGYVKC